MLRQRPYCEFPDETGKPCIRPTAKFIKVNFYTLLAACRECAAYAKKEHRKNILSKRKRPGPGGFIQLMQVLKGNASHTGTANSALLKTLKTERRPKMAETEKPAPKPEPEPPPPPDGEEDKEETAA